MKQFTPAMTASEATVHTADRLHSAAIHLLRRLRRQDAASGLTAPRLSALSVIVFSGPLTLGALAAAEGVRPPTMTRIVAALEESGLITRQAGPRDRREILVEATDSGKQLLADGRTRRVQTFAHQLAGLPPAELATLERAAEILDRLARE
jgi:DNA-binding MarR family transcriptional regulator